MAKRILLVEDDTRLSELIAEYLEQNGFEAAIEDDGAKAVDRILSEQPDLVVLDVMLPGEDGLSICRRIRPRYSGPVLMLTARGEEFDQVLGLEMGADDYVAKPVGPRLLLARIKALLRRKTSSSDRFEDNQICIDLSTREVRVSGHVFELTTAEFDLLWALARRVGRPVERQDLFKELRGIDYDGLDRSMDVRVSQLRKKLFLDGGYTDRIKTVRGVGYQFIRLSS
ncbi:MAG: response regulator [Proteobacteria bacterium]|jgi:two-component system, OmpR family, response regulator RstA|nr:response regulator [Pseudomonadota bacterium]